MIDTPSTPAHLKPMMSVLVNLPHYKELGLSLVSLEVGRCTLRLDYQERLAGNPVTGVLHGGAISSLLDSVCGAVAFSSLDKPAAVATLDLRIDYLHPARPGLPVFGQAETYRMTRHVAFVRGSAYQEGEADMIAHCTATLMVGSTGFLPNVVPTATGV